MAQDSKDLKQMYRTVMEDHFPDSLRLIFGEQELVYRKRAWRFPDDKTGELIDSRIDGEPLVHDLASKDLFEPCIHNEPVLP